MRLIKVLYGVHNLNYQTCLFNPQNIPSISFHLSCHHFALIKIEKCRKTGERSLQWIGMGCYSSFTKKKIKQMNKWLAKITLCAQLSWQIDQFFCRIKPLQSFVRNDCRDIASNEPSHELHPTCWVLLQECIVCR